MGYISHIELPNGTTYDIQDNQPAVLDIPNTPASIATFSGASNLPLSSLKVAVTPYQDLHGYDAPWAGGAGKNKAVINDDTLAKPSWYGSGVWSGTTKVSEGQIQVTRSNQQGGMGGIVINNVTPNTKYTLSFNAEVGGTIYYGYTTDGTTIKTQNTLGTYPAGDKSFNITIPSNTVGFYIKFAAISVPSKISKIQFEVGSQATTYMPAENICPIIGWDEAVVTRTGKNLWGGEKLADDIVAKVPNATKDTTNKTVTYSASQVSRKVFLDKFKENTQYTFYLSATSSYTNMIIVYSDGTSDGIEPNTYKVTQANKSVTLVRGAWASGTTVLKYEECGIFEGVLTAQDYEPYNGTTYTIDLDGTRYGGELDAVSGTMTVDEVSVDMGTLNWIYADANKYFYANIANKAVGFNNIICSIYKTSVHPGIGNLGDKSIVGETSGRSVLVKDLAYSTATDFKTAMNGVQLVYELATPITVQLAPTPVKSIEGENNISANCGQITEGKYVVSKYNGMTAKISEVAYSATNATSATTASKLGSSNVGSATRPIYLSAGTATACTYTLGKSVPSNAVFTDTQANWTQTTATALDYIKNKPTFGTALTLSGTTVNHSNYGSSGTAGTSSATHGATLAVPYVTTNGQGHVTGKGTHTHTVTGIQHNTTNISRVVLYDDGQVSVQTKGYLSCNNYANSGFKPMTASAFNVSSSRKVKENIEPIADEEAYKLLDVTPVSFDYISEIGGAKNQFGVIAEEVNDILPFVVSIPEDYKEDDGNYMNVPSVDYSKFIPHLIKLVQIQEQKINDLQKEIFELKNK